MENKLKENKLKRGEPIKSTSGKRTPTQRVKESPLKEEDWLKAASDILADENYRGIRIDTLCDRLGVTKGSFYWHFKGRAQLLSALLVHWRQRMTTNVIERLTALGDTPSERLRALFDLPRQPNSPKFARVEQSVRDWARNADYARSAVREVDEMRLNYFKSLLQQQGLSEEIATRRAYIAYSIMMGDSILTETLAKKKDPVAVTDEVMSLLTQDAQNKPGEKH
ncbi:MAG: TetR/AcrR family transcriptional regulator [Granulosicoccus sp.]|nr:TetR/AcrR family transcriptional regulator [Granulosicoccus sp.]